MYVWFDIGAEMLYFWGSKRLVKPKKTKYWYPSEKRFFLGGGAIEMELSKMLRDYSRTIAGKEQLLIGAVAKALEIIPRQLCDNAGFDATNILNKLRQKHAQG